MIINNVLKLRLINALAVKRLDVCECVSEIKQMSLIIVLTVVYPSKCQLRLAASSEKSHFHLLVSH